MLKKLLMVGVLAIGVALLSGCGLLDYITDAITGIVDAIKAPTLPSVVMSGRAEFHLAAMISETPPPSSPGGSSIPGIVGTTFYSGSGVYDEDFRSFSAFIWDGGDFSDTGFTAYLSEDGKTIESFWATQTQANVWFAWTYVHYIRAVNVPYSHTEGNSRYYIARGTAARTLVTDLDYKAWSTSLGSAQAPAEWVTGPGALTGSADDVISIRLDY